MKRVIELIAVLAVCALPLVLWRGEAKLRSWHEGMSMASSQETWLRSERGEQGAWMVPSFNGEPRVVKPPMVVWLNLLAWSGIQHDSPAQSGGRVVAPEKEKEELDSRSPSPLRVDDGMKSGGFRSSSLGIAQPTLQEEGHGGSRTTPLSTAQLAPQETQGLQDELLSRARLVSAGLGLLAVAGVWVIGRVMVSDACGVLGALVMGSFIVGFQKYARMNTYDIALLGFSTAAIAGGMWAAKGARSQEPGSRIMKSGDWARVMIGWGVCAVMGACAYMSKGPLSILIVGMGLVPAIVLSILKRSTTLPSGESWHRRTLAHVVGFGIVCLVMWGSGKWWYSLVAERVPRLAETMANEYDGPEWDVRPWWWYLTRVSLVMPWAVMVVGAAGVMVTRRSQHPEARSQKEEVGTEIRGQRSEVRQEKSTQDPGPRTQNEEKRRSERRGLIAVWVWTLGLLVFFSCVGAKVERYVLPVLPGLAVLIADAWLRCAKSERGEAGWWVCVVQWGICACGTVGLALWISLQEWLVDRGWIEREAVRNPGDVVVIGCGVAMMVCCVLSWKMFLKKQAVWSGVMLGMWGMIAGILYAGATSGLVGGWVVVKRDAMSAGDVTYEEGGGRLLVRGVDDLLEPEFVFYSAEVFERISVKELKDAVKAGNGPGVLLATRNEKNEGLMRELGYEAVQVAQDDSRKMRLVWRKKQEVE